MWRVLNGHSINQCLLLCQKLTGYNLVLNLSRVNLTKQWPREINSGTSKQRNA